MRLKAPIWSSHCRRRQLLQVLRSYNRSTESVEGCVCGDCGDDVPAPPCRDIFRVLSSYGSIPLFLLEIEGTTDRLGNLCSRCGESLASLIACLLEFEPTSRSTARQTVAHDYFWTLPLAADITEYVSLSCAFSLMEWRRHPSHHILCFSSFGDWLCSQGRVRRVEER